MTFHNLTICTSGIGLDQVETVTLALLALLATLAAEAVVLAQEVALTFAEACSSSLLSALAGA